MVSPCRSSHISVPVRGRCPSATARFDWLPTREHRLALVFRHAHPADRWHQVHRPLTSSSRRSMPGTTSPSSIAASTAPTCSPTSSTASATATPTCPRWPTDSWDATVDTCAYFPRQVHELAEVLGDRAGHYQQVSSVSAYASPSVAAMARTHRWPCSTIPTSRRSPNETYGGLKVLCERVAVERFGPAQHHRAADLRRRAGRLHLAVPVVGRRASPGAASAGTRPGRCAVTAHRRT